jgi:hypothetical protein
MFHKVLKWFLAISSGTGGGLDAHRMMTGDDTGGDVWTVAGGWEGLAWSRGAT